jgi:hypothetical protein
MTRVPWDDAKLKALFKTALVEVLEERKDLLRDAIKETIEDIAMARAIKEGRRTEDVSRGEVLSLLEGGRGGSSRPESRMNLRTDWKDRYYYHRVWNSHPRRRDHARLFFLPQDTEKKFFDCRRSISRDGHLSWVRTRLLPFSHRTVASP